MSDATSDYLDAVNRFQAARTTCVNLGDTICWTGEALRKGAGAPISEKTVWPDAAKIKTAFEEFMAARDALTPAFAAVPEVHRKNLPAPEKV